MTENTTPEPEPEQTTATTPTPTPTPQTHQKPNKCKCGCGEQVAEGKQYIKGHQLRRKKTTDTQPKPKPTTSTPPQPAPAEGFKTLQYIGHELDEDIDELAYFDNGTETFFRLPEAVAIWNEDNLAYKLISDRSGTLIPAHWIPGFIGYFKKDEIDNITEARKHNEPEPEPEQKQEQAQEQTTPIELKEDPPIISPTQDEPARIITPPELEPDQVTNQEIKIDATEQKEKPKSLLGSLFRNRKKEERQIQKTQAEQIGDMLRTINAKQTTTR